MEYELNLSKIKDIKKQKTKKTLSIWETEDDLSLLQVIFWQVEDNPPPPLPWNDAFTNLTEGWLSSSKIFLHS
jgi:hypothetical protein